MPDTSPNKEFVNVEDIIKSLSPVLLKLLPKFIINYFKKIIHEKELNDGFNKYQDKIGLDFVESVLQELGVKVKVIGEENIPVSGRYIFIANHPLGGLDGLALIYVVGKYHKNIKFIVNEILTKIVHLQHLFVPINKYAKSPFDYLRKIDETYESDAQILNFPAGICSRKIKGKIIDLKWQKSFIKEAIKYQRDIVPVYVDGRNTDFFYNLANACKYLGIKANIEFLYLIDEMFKQRGQTITLYFGEPISYDIFDRSMSLGEWTDRLKDHVYAIGNAEKPLIKTKKITSVLYNKYLHLPRPRYIKLPVRKSVIIPAVDKHLLEAELTKEKFLRHTNFGYNEIYVVTYYDSPNVMREISRLREITYRKAGGGTHKECDIDEYDTGIVPYKQLIVWDPERKEIIGAYRFMLCKDAPYENGRIKLATAELFDFSNTFKKEYLPYAIELGRSFIQPIYQSSKTSRKGIFSLDNLWDGLGALVVNNPSIKYFFGKVTMYPNYNRKARDMILYFLKKYFPDPDHLLIPHRPILIDIDEEELEKIFIGENYEDDYKILFTCVRELKENIPPLLNSYMNLSPSMRTFGTALNKSFGNVEETGIMITIDDIYPHKKERHIASYRKVLLVGSR